MTVMVVTWGLQPVKDALNGVSTAKFAIPGLTDSILKSDGSLLPIKPFELNYLSNSGIAVLAAAFLSMPLIGLPFREGIKVLGETLRQLVYPFITIASVVGFAFIVNNSGMSITIALALASTGVLFPVFSPVLGWLGVFLTGSDTSSNALFGKLQATSAETIGIDPVVTVSANASGGVTGKMISPQSIAVGTASVGLVGKESDLLRFTVKHSFIMLAMVCVIIVLQAYVFTGVIPEYSQVGTATKVAPQVSTGFTYLMILGAILLVLTATILLMNRRKIAAERAIIEP